MRSCYYRQRRITAPPDRFRHFAEFLGISLDTANITDPLQVFVGARPFCKRHYAWSSISELHDSPSISVAQGRIRVELIVDRARAPPAGLFRRAGGNSGNHVALDPGVHEYERKHREEGESGFAGEVGDALAGLQFEQLVRQGSPAG